MQTFLPYADLRASCQVLDSPRLGKQRVEVFQVLRALTWPEYAWKQHPAVRMWRGFVPGLVLYGVQACREWVRRGSADSLEPQLLQWTGGRVPVDPDLPPWFGTGALHLSHRSALLRKDPGFYRPLFGDDPDDLPYLWPPDLWPRWPARRGDREASLAVAEAALGVGPARPWQVTAVEAVRSGRDCLAVVRPGHGATTAGLLAALATPGTTTLVVAPLGPPDDAVPPPFLMPPREATGAVSPAIAREPSAVDLVLMHDEQRPPEVHVRVGTAAASPGDGVVVLDGPVALAPGPRPPVLALAERGESGLAQWLGLVDPLLLGAGWDPASTRLEVRRAPTGPRARESLVELVRARPPALVMAADRGRADRLVTALRARGLRVAAWAEGMRADRAADAVARWRGRRLDALVVPHGPLPSLGRIRPVSLLALDAPAEHGIWWSVVDELSPAFAVLVSTPGGPLEALAGAPGCRRAALVAPYGQPVHVPCGRCDVCAPDG